MNEGQLYINKLNIHIFGKDKNGCFIFCNESLAKAAGTDSPSYLIGKSDYHSGVIWHEQADFFHKGDVHAMQGGIWQNMVERQIQKNRVANVLVTKHPLTSNKGECIGVIGSYIDITHHNFILAPHRDMRTDKKFYLGTAFGNGYLTQQEFAIFKQLTYGLTAKRIAKHLNISFRTAEHHINSIKKKLQCQNKGDIVMTAIQHGLVFMVCQL